MAATVAADFVFQPKVWKDHVSAYFDDKLLFGAIAMRDDSLTAQPGTTQNFPYFKQIGVVEEPAETASLAVDSLSDDSFSATVKEVGKAVGVKKKAFKVSAANTERIIAEITSQMGRRHAEKIDDDLLTEMSTVGSYVDGFTATVAADTLNVRSVLKALVVGFGDHHEDAIAIQMHSKQLYDLMSDSTSGFLKADANDPMYNVPGFSGRLFGMAIFVSDKIPNNGGVQIDSKDAYNAFIHKMDPYGILLKQDMEMESDYDLLAREWLFTSNQWYAVKSFHAKISALDYKTVRMTTTVSL